MVRHVVQQRMYWLVFALVGIGIIWIGCDQMHDQILSVSPGSSPFEINSATVVGDTLLVSVSFVGGCETHEFMLGIDDSFLESNPVRMHAWLFHDASGDTCEAYLTEKHEFDLTRIKTRYQKAYQRQEGVVLILLEGAPQGPLSYEF